MKEINKVIIVLKNILKEIKNDNVDFKNIYKELRNSRKLIENCKFEKNTDNLIKICIFNFKEHVKIIEYLATYEPYNIDALDYQITKLKEILKEIKKADN